jgi:acetyl-CoA synthetase
MGYMDLFVQGHFLMFKGDLNQPKPDRLWEVVERSSGEYLYTTPLFCGFARERVEWVEKHDLSSLRVLGSVGEPIGPKLWMWYYTHVGWKDVPSLIPGGRRKQVES